MNSEYRIVYYPNSCQYQIDKVVLDDDKVLTVCHEPLITGKTREELLLRLSEMEITCRKPTILRNV